jgi:hypothetical protein
MTPMRTRPTLLFLAAVTLAATACGKKDGAATDSTATSGTPMAADSTATSGTPPAAAMAPDSAAMRDSMARDSAKRDSAMVPAKKP